MRMQEDRAREREFGMMKMWYRRGIGRVAD